MIRFQLLVCLIAITCFCRVFAQPEVTYRTINLTIDTREPAGVNVDRGRVVWRERKADDTTFNVRFFNGRDILTLDTGLIAVRALIDREHVAWISSSGRIRVYSIVNGMTYDLAMGVFDDSSAAIAIANGLIAYVRDVVGGGTEIVLSDAYGSSDTAFSAARWNRAPALHHGQLAWAASGSQSIDSASSVWFFDGRAVRKLSGSSLSRNEQPVVADGQVAWLRSDGDGEHVALFTGDTTIDLADAPDAAARIIGYALSNGVAVCATYDTASDSSRIRILDTETSTTAGTVLSYRGVIGSLGIDNGLVSWESRDSASDQPLLRVYDIASGAIRDANAAVAPAGDDGVFAWTFGDAVELNLPITSERLTTNGNNGWPQTRFQNIDDGRMIWGDLDNSQFARIMYNDGAATVRLTDSLLYKDFLMLNDGRAIWRQDFNQLWLSDANGVRRIVDSLQCENMHVDGGHIGFFGFRAGSGSSINQAWMYDIAASSLRQLTSDTSGGNYIVLVDSNRAVWMRDSGGIAWMRYHDGSTTRVLSDSLVTGKYGFSNGLIVWGELRAGVSQVMSYDVASDTVRQLTNGNVDMTDPATDGKHVVWFSPLDSTMWYHDIASGRTRIVTKWLPHPAEWITMSDGLVSFVSNNEVYSFDGDVLHQPTPYIFGTKESAMVDRGHLAWKAGPVGTPGDIYRSRMLAHVAFDARNITGRAPLDVAFDNMSWGAATSYSWDFGDGASSTERNPRHTYSVPGAHTVSLTVSAPGGNAIERKVRLVRVIDTASSADDDRRPSVAMSLRPFIAPNPSDGDLTLHFALAHAGRARVTLCDLSGRTIVSILSEELGAGSHVMRVPAPGIASGTYFCRIESGGVVAVSRPVIVVH